MVRIERIRGLEGASDALNPKATDGNAIELFLF